MRAPIEPRVIRRVKAGAWAEEAADELIAEEPLEIRLNGRSVVVTMRTPGDDEELALGLLHNEGILRRNANILSIHTLANPLDEAHGNLVDVRVDTTDIAQAPGARTFHATSACGVCGKASLDTVLHELPPLSDGPRVALTRVLAMPAVMRAAQNLFERTGGLHAAATFTPEGDLLAIREDVGRHNAVDKITGWAARQKRLPLSGTVLLLSGRAGFEVVQKAAASGIPIVAAVGAPTSLATRLAERAGITLIGFLRDEACNVYTHPERIA